MSDSSGVFMYVVVSSYRAPGKIYDGYRNPDQAPNLADFLASSSLESDKVPDYIRVLKKMAFSTRGDYFMTRIRELAAASGIEGLDLFAAGESLDKRTETIKLNDSEQCFEYKNIHRYGLIYGKNQLNTTITSIDRLIDWCLAHSEETSTITDYEDADEIIQIINGAYCTLNPNKDAPSDEGQGPGFLFCVLKTIGDLLRYAKWWDLMVVYNNESIIYDT